MKSPQTGFASVFSGVSPRATVLRLLLFALTGTLVLLVFTQSASLLYAGAISDYNCFTFIARAWADGHVPYVDFIDNKGPLLYLIDRFGLWLLPGKAGIFILEMMAFAATFELLWRTGAILGAGRRTNIVAAATAVFLYIYHIIEGNTTEEWSLPFTALALYVTACMLAGGLGHKDSRRLASGAAIMGMCAGLCMMLRANNAAPVVGLALGMGLTLGLNQRYGTLSACAGAFVAGVCVAVAPFVAYLAAHGALQQMWFATVELNIAYMANFDPNSHSLGRMAANVMQMGGVIVLPFVARATDRRRGSQWCPVLAVMSTMVFFVFLTGTGWSHYYMMALPSAWLAIALAGTVSRRWLVIALAACVIPEIALHPLAAGWYARNTWVNATVESPADNDRRVAEFIVSNVPEDEMDSLYLACAPGDIAAVELTGHRPVGRYFNMQDKALTISSAARHDIALSFAKANPRWILSYLPLECYEGLIPAEKSAAYLRVDSLEISPLGYGFRLYRRVTSATPR